jgi:hypothetical protein
MRTAIIQQFNPASGCWNTLYEVDASNYNENEPIAINKYSGPYRVLFRGDDEKKVDISILDVVKEEQLEEEEQIDEAKDEEVVEFTNKFGY